MKNNKFYILALKGDLKQLERKISSLENLIKYSDQDDLLKEIFNRECDREKFLVLTKKQINIMKDHINVLKERIKLLEDCIINNKYVRQ